MLRTIVVLPMEKLAAHITEVRRSGDLSSRLNMQRDDEIGSLANEFDKLTDEVSEARQLLLDQSFKAGRADTAAEVLHNIRNAMTPLINGLDRLGQQLRVAAGLKIKRATEELQDSDCPTDRRGKLLTYIDSAFDRILETNNASDEELKIASKQARQVEAILSDQERHAKAAPVIENLGLDEVLAEAMLVIPKRKKPRVDVDLPVTLSWQAVDEAESYDLQVSELADFSVLVSAPQGLTATSEEVNVLVGGTMYYWHARSVNAAGD